MPLYEYKCNKCKQVYEKLETNPQQQITCINCGGIAKRIISNFNHNIFTEDRKKKLKEITGTEIENSKQLEHYERKTNTITLSRREWMEIKARRDSYWHNKEIKLDKNKLKDNMAEAIKEVRENEEIRRMTNLYNLKKRKEAEDILNNRIENVKI
jgi:putative FmdB family regulatory protein